MQITLSLSTLVALISGTVGVTLVMLAAFSVIWRGGAWIGTLFVILAAVAWIHGLIIRETRRLAVREDAAFDMGKAAVRSIN